MAASQASARPALIAPLHIQLTDPREAPPRLIKSERFASRSHSAEDTPITLGTNLVHFSENPISTCSCLLSLSISVIWVQSGARGTEGSCRTSQPMLLGLLGQFLVMPFYAFLMAKVFMLPKALALGLIITCSAARRRGGATFSLLLGGDVTLAISMTFISTVAATGFLPLSSAIYSRLLSIHETLHVPVSKIRGPCCSLPSPLQQAW